MYNKEISREDILNEIINTKFKIEESIDGQSDFINKKMNEQVDKINDICDESKRIIREIESLTKIMQSILFETRKTNIFLKSIANFNNEYNIDQFDLDKHSNRSLVVVGTGFMVAQEYAQKLVDKSNRQLIVIDGLRMCDIVSKLANAEVNDYVLVNYDCLFDTEKECINSAVLDNMVCIKNSSLQTIKIDLKPINYILYSDMLELINLKLFSDLDVVK